MRRAPTKLPRARTVHTTERPPGTESGRTDVVAADSGSQLPVTGVDIGVAAGIAGALMVLGGLLIGRRATAN